MEGPSLYLAAQRLAPFVGKTVLTVDGNTHIGKERMDRKRVLKIFSWGKHLVLQFDTFALRIHFMMYGSYAATVNGKSVTGDYKKKKAAPRLILSFKNGKLICYSCSLKYLEMADAYQEYDHSVNVMHEEWDEKQAIKAFKKHPKNEIADVLLDQNHFAGVGNIIKNEILCMVKVRPTTQVSKVPLSKLKKLAKLAKEFSFDFYNWRQTDELRKHLLIYHKGQCPYCRGKVTRKKTGLRNRVSFFCLKCQK